MFLCEVSQFPKCHRPTKMHLRPHSAWEPQIPGHRCGSAQGQGALFLEQRLGVGRPGRLGSESQPTHSFFFFLIVMSLFEPNWWQLLGSKISVPQPTPSHPPLDFRPRLAPFSDRMEPDPLQALPKYLLNEQRSRFLYNKLPGGSSSFSPSETFLINAIYLSYLHTLWAVWAWASYLTSLCFCFLTCKWEW